MAGKGRLERIDGYPVLRLRGTPYEMGFQHGTLLKEECLSLIRFLLTVKSDEASIDVLGRKLGPRDALRLIWALQRRFVPERYVEEMTGLADALGIDPMDVFVANSIPELFHCSGFALLGETTEGGSLLHGRVLDYGTDWKLQEHAVLIVAEPDGRVPFVNVGYSGFVGSVTGMNREGISIGEMGGRGQGRWGGTPMSFLVRRALEEASTLKEAVAVFRDSRRTCEYFYVVASGRENAAVGLDASWGRFGVIGPGDAEERLPTPVPGTVLLSAGSRYRTLADRVRRRLAGGGKFSVKQAIRLMDQPVAMRSNLHNVLMAPALLKLWVANASPEGKPAWTQPYHEFDIRSLLAAPQTPPQTEKAPRRTAGPR